MRFMFPVLVVFAGLQLCAGTAVAAVSVISSNFAHACYEAARDGAVVTEPCDKSFEIEMLVGRDRAATYVNRAIVLTNGRHLNAALEDLVRAEEVMPELGEIYVSRGNVYYYRHRYKEALELYDLSIAKGVTELFAVHYDRGLVLERLGRTEEAKAAFRQSLELAPDFSLARESLAAYENGTAVQ
jgi:tetratricopeptide (TPR) repeat protein